MSNYPPNNPGGHPPAGGPMYPGNPNQPPYPPPGMQTQPFSQDPNQQPPKKGSKVVIWSLVGCGTLVVLIAIGATVAFYWVGNRMKQAGIDPEMMERNPELAAAKIIVAMNPDLEMVSVDEAKKTVTVKHKKDGKIVTVSFKDAADGKISFEGPDGQKGTIRAQGDGNTGSVEVDAGDKGKVIIGGSNAKLPSWLPPYPGAKMTGVFSSDTPQAQTSSFQFETNDGADEVVDFYREALEEEGFKVTTNKMEQNGKPYSSQVTAEDASRKRQAFINAFIDGNQTRVTMALTQRP